MSAKEETRTDTAPKRLGRYRLLRKIARGGMAEVFVGRSYGAHGFEKTVAIKRILSRYSEDPQFVRMMVDEAKISVLLTHPNIAQVLEFGEEQGRYFLVMEYVPGQSLSALVKKLRAAQERLDVLEACFLIVEALQGLHAAHIQTDPWGKPAGIIHRDVSPQNILLSYDGHVKVIDFGIARARDRLEKTQIGTIKGKLRYLAPEMIDPQRFSKKGDFDHRVDVFAAGIILYELVAGRTLFTGADELEVYDHITRGEIPDLSLEKLCDPPLMRIIRRALERDPDKRYPSGEAFADELRAYLYRRDPAFNNKRLAAVLERHFGEEKAQRQALEEPDPALSDEQLEVHLTRTSHTPSRSRELPAMQQPAQSEVWAASGSSSASAPQSGTSVSRRAPRNRRTGEIPAALGDHLQAAPDAETRVGDPMELQLEGEISQTQADPTAHLEVDGDSSQETSTSVVPARKDAAPPMPATPVREVRREPQEDTPATNRRLAQSTRPSRGPALAIAGAVVVGLLLAVVVVVALEARNGSVEVVSVNAGDPVTVGESPPIPSDAVPLLVAATPQSAKIELVGQPGTSSAPAVFMVTPGAEVEVRVSAPGYEARRERVIVEEGEPQLRISVTLSPLPVTLTVQVEPESAEVTVDEQPYRPGMDVTPGLPVVVRARAEGHEAREEAVTPKAGEPLTLSLVLPAVTPPSTPTSTPTPRAQQQARSKPKPAARGSLTITSTPYWGRVTIDGKTLEETTPLTVKLKAGTHSVEVSHPPKGIVERFTIKVEPGDKLRRTVKFK